MPQGGMELNFTGKCKHVWPVCLRGCCFELCVVNVFFVYVRCIPRGKLVNRIVLTCLQQGHFPAIQEHPILPVARLGVWTQARVEFGEGCSSLLCFSYGS